MGNRGPLKKTMFFAATVAVCLLAASHQFPDIVKVKGEIGGTAKPIPLQSGLEQYALSTQLTVAPGVRGDVAIALEGSPPIPYEIYNHKAPVIDLGLSRFHRLEGRVLKDVRPSDEPVYLRIFMHPPRVDPVCGMTCEKKFLSGRDGWKTYRFCSRECQEAFSKAPERYRDRDGLTGEYALVLTSETGEKLLRVPLRFEATAGAVMPEGHVH